MNCLICARTGAERTAVALCPNCGAGLCLDHVEQNARADGPGGTLLACGHHTWYSAPQHAVHDHNRAAELPHV
jgi:Uncharacterized protein conserved in archaea (DUF2180)